MANLKRNDGESDESYYKRRAAKHEAYKIMNRGQLIPNQVYSRKERRTKEFKKKLAEYQKKVAEQKENVD